MTKEKKEGGLYLAPMIPTVDGLQSYPADIVREMYINSDKTIEDLAREMNLPVATVELYSKSGMQTWYQLKQSRLGERLKYFLDVNVDNLMETHSHLEEMHFLTLVQFKGMQTFLKGYYLKHGHLFRVNEDGEMSLDTYGVPIPVPIPNAPKHFMALEGFLRLKEGTKQAMNHVFETTKKGDKPDVLDIDDYGIFEEKE